MNLSTPDSPKKVDPKSILLIGPPGSRKTGLAMEFPGICFFDIDGNLDGAVKALTELKKIAPTFGYENIWLNEKGQRIDIADCIDNLGFQMDSLRSSIMANQCPFKVACIDGLRNLGEMIKAKIYKAQRRGQMETRDWDSYKTDMLKIIFIKARNLGIHTIFTCHERAVYQQSSNAKEMMKEYLVGYEPIVQGGIQDGFGGFFTDVWRCTVEPAGGNTREMKITTVKSPLSPDLKSSVGLPSEIVIKQGELAWPKLEPYFKGIL